MLGQESVVRVNHVLVVVAREARAQAVGRLARFPVPDRVRQDDVVAAGVERLPGTEELAGEYRCEQRSAGLRRAVEHDDRLSRGRADRSVMQPQLRQHLAALKAEVAHDPAAFARRRIVGGADRDCDQGACGTQELQGLHVSLRRKVVILLRPG